MTDDEMIKHATRAQLQEMLRLALEHNKGYLQMLDEYKEALRIMSPLAEQMHARLETTTPVVMRDYARQMGTRKPRKPRRPRLDAWLDRALRADPDVESDDLWASIPEPSSDDDLWREDGRVFEDGVRLGLSRGGFDSAVRRAKERAAIR